MDARITPEPTPEELEAIEEALGRLLEPETDPHGAWWRAGVEENLDPEGENG